MAYTIGTAGSDVLSGTGGNDVLYGAAGNDRLDGRAGNDVLVGGAGNDLFILRQNEGFDSIADAELGDRLKVMGHFYDFDWAKRDGADLVIFFVEDEDYTQVPANGIRILNHYAGSALGGIEADLTLSNLNYGLDASLTKVVFAAGLAGTNQGDGMEAILGTEEDDTVTSGGGYYDYVSTFDGDDSITISAGTQFAFVNPGDGNDTVIGGAGREIFRGSRGFDSYDGGAGEADRIDYRDSTGGIKVDLARTTAQYVSDYDGADILKNIEVVYGSRFNDKIYGDAKANSLVGRDGRDTLDGRAGADTLEGGQDNDVYYVDNAGDLVVELAGTLGGNDRVIASITYTLTSFVERLSLAGSAALNGTGNEAANRLDGNAAANILSGLGGNDTLLGGAGNDTLLGGEGNDRLLGQAGRDTLTGGAGSDRFEWDWLEESSAAAPDIVTDFTKGADRLVLRDIDAVTATAADESFAFIGTAAFTAAGQVRAVVSGGNTLVQVNADAATGTVEMAIQLTGFTGILAASDFLL
ncbi:calcium-binding protein [Roseomonas sp. 18066]|uniref:calcium-binding protein n=1 Tax=Roseomonas sp. 18066 TaxID=2681412 RepID=UPI0013577DCE|nr:calcium-binding protein [Roseomonas sp. 18066]